MIYMYYDFTTYMYIKTDCSGIRYIITSQSEKSYWQNTFMDILAFAGYM